MRVCVSVHAFACAGSLLYGLLLMKGITMEIRPATMQDFDAISAVYADGRAQLAQLGIDQWQSGRPFPETIRADIEHRELYVATEQDVFLGVAMFTVRGDVEYDSIDGAWNTPGTSQNPDYLTIHRVATNTHVARRGTATALFGFAETLARQHHLQALRVDTHPGNIRMQALLEKLGYSHVGSFHLLHTTEPTKLRYVYEKLLS